MRIRTGVSLVSAALLAACSKSGQAGLTVSATSRSTSGQAAATAASIDAGHGLTIDRLRLLVRQAEVEGAPACPGPTGATGATGADDGTGMTSRAGTARLATQAVVADDGGGSSDHGGGGSDGDVASTDEGSPCEVEAGPFLVDLSGADLASGVHPVSAVDVPSGTYDEVNFKVDTISATAAGADAGLRAMVDAGASILVDGTRSITVGGVPATAPFTFATSMTVTQKHEGPIVVDSASGANVTLDVDPSAWFSASDGSLLDPADAASRSAIEENIRASILVLEDHDRDGHEDGGHD